MREASLLAELPAPDGTDSCRQSSDAARLTSLVREHFDAVWRLIRRLGMSESDVDDAVQQVFLIASRRLSGLLPGKERAFLFGSAVRVASEGRRRFRRRREVDSELITSAPDPGPRADEQIERREALALLDAILDSMDDSLREVLVLIDIEGLTIAELADMQDIPVGTASSRLRRARADFHARIRRAQAASAARKEPS